MIILSKLIDLTGQRFGRLTVIKRAEDHISKSGIRSVQWLCQCDCGNQSIVGRADLKTGNTKSCGCLHQETSHEMGKSNKKYNTYDLTGEYGIGYTSKGKEFYFDLEDYDLIKDYYWRIDSLGYVVSNDGKKIIKMHRFIMGFPEKKYDVDHKHGKETRNDNRKNNLRIATRSQNLANKDLISNNTTGITGVSWNKQRNTWRANIGVNKKRINLGTFENFEDAVKARKEAEEKYFGEFSYDNSMKSSNF